MYRFRTYTALLILGLALVPIKAGIAQDIVPLTQDIQVDETPPENSGTHSPAMALNNQNMLMIVWAETGRAGNTKIYGRIYHTRGEALTAEFRVDQSSDESSSISGNIDIATDQEGNFYVVWSHIRKEDSQIFIRAFSTNGKSITKEIDVETNPEDTTQALSPAIAINNQNMALVAWVSDGKQVQARFFNIAQARNIEPINEEIRVDQNSSQIPMARDPHVTSGPEGDFLVTWVDNRTQFLRNQTIPRVFARQFHATGKELGGDFLVQEETPQQIVNCREPAATINANKAMFFCWNDGRNFETTGQNSVYGRALSWDQTPLTPEVNISPCIPTDRPAIAIDSLSRLTLVYSRNMVTEQEFNQAKDHIGARRYTLDFKEISPLFIIDQGGTVALNTQFDIALSNQGTIFTTWNQNIVHSAVDSSLLGHVFFNILGEGLTTGPSNLTATDIGTDFIIWQWEWNDSTQINAEFYLKNENNRIVSPLLPSDTRKWEEFQLKPNIPVSRMVIAVYNDLESQPSNMVTRHTLSEPPSLLKKARVTENSVLISWVGNGGTRYAVERANDVSGQPINWRFLVEWNDSLATTEYEDQNLLSSTVYWYRIRGYNGDGIITSPSLALRVITESKVLLAPSDFFGTVLSDSSILWQWQDNSTNESGFFVLDETGKPVSSQLPGDSIRFLESNLNPNEATIRSVIAVDAASNYSNTSNLDTVFTLASAPENLNILETTPTTIKLKWYSANATAFLIERANDEENQPGMWQMLKSWRDQQQQTNFQDTKLTPATTYWYRVRSYNQKGVLNNSANMMSATTEVFSGPTNFQGSAVSTTEIMWEWQDNSVGETGYQIFSPEGQPISKMLPPDTTSWTESNLQPNQPYYRFVQAFLSTGQLFIKSNGDTVYTLANPPSELMASQVTSTSIRLSWQEQGATRFAVERAVAGPNETWEFIRNWSHQLTIPEYEDTGLEPNTEYRYRVRGYNGDGIQTEPGNIISVTTQQSVLNPPTQLQGQAISPFAIQWRWQDNTRLEANYVVKDENHEVISGLLPANTTSWIDSNLTTNTRYARQVFALNSEAQESGGSNLRWIYSLAQPPDTLEISRLKNDVELSWSDHYASFYNVERALENQDELQWEVMAQQLSDTSFLDNTLENGLHYWYRIIAFNGDSLRTAPSPLASTRNAESIARPGDLNHNLVWDLEDLYRLVEIILEKGPEPDYQELYLGNIYDADEVINIHDVIALIDSLLSIPTLFRSGLSISDSSIQVEMALIPNLGGSRKFKLSFSNSPAIEMLAFQIDLKTRDQKDVPITIEANDAPFAFHSRLHNQQFRCIGYATTSENPLRDLIISVNSDDNIQLTVDELVIADTEHRVYSIELANQSITLGPSMASSGFHLLQNYPNPFNAQTAIYFQSNGKFKNAKLTIYNLLGQQIQCLWDRELNTGLHKVIWNGKDEQNHYVPSGIYVYQLTVGSQQFTKKLLVIR